jgi:rhodanese-related sulfurtransferase
MPFEVLKSSSALRAAGKLLTPLCKHPHRSQITAEYLSDISEKVFINFVKGTELSN